MPAETSFPHIAPRETYQIGSGHLVLETGRATPSSIAKATFAPGIRVWTALWNRVGNEDDAEAAAIGRALSRRFDRVVVLVNPGAKNGMRQWGFADALTSATRDADHHVTCLIGTDLAESLGRAVETMADDEVVIAYTRDLPSARLHVRNLGGLPTDFIEAKPPSQRHPSLFVERATPRFALAS